jgi:hypothetical protein
LARGPRRRLEQAEAVRRLGGHAVEAPDLPAGGAGHDRRLAGFSGAAVVGRGRGRRAQCRPRAGAGRGRDGPILPLIGGLPDRGHVFHERHACIDTTASGGNAYGDNLEEALGRLGFLMFYLAGGVLAGLAQWAVAPWSLEPVLGASGAIAAVMGGYLLLWPRARIDVLIFLIVYARVVTVSVWIIMALWLVVQVLGGLGLDAAGANVAYAAHLGGFAAGLALALPLWIRRGGTAGWQESQGHPPHPPSFSRRPARNGGSPWG